MTQREVSEGGSVYNFSLSLSLNKTIIIITIIIIVIIVVRHIKYKQTFKEKQISSTEI